jgi:hypothetical protein
MADHDNDILDDGEEEEQYLPEDDASDGELEARFPMPAMRTSLEKAILVDGLPQVPAEKYDKLLMLVEKIFTQVGTLAEDGLLMPKDPVTGVSKGYAQSASVRAGSWSSSARMAARSARSARWLHGLHGG